MSECNICSIMQKGTIIMQHGIRTVHNGNITIHHLSGITAEWDFHIMQIDVSKYGKEYHDTE